MRKSNWKLVLSWLVQIVLVGLVIGFIWSAEPAVLLTILIVVWFLAAFLMSGTYLLQYYYDRRRKP
ncbi:MAG: hypothetical protein LC650_00560 [Actinobacteria bacterium]|nr:hypothetical protein [Actinomycetota bacterium]